MFSVFFNSFKLWLVFVCQGSYSLRFLVCGSLATARRPSGSFVKCLHINDADELKARAVLRSFGCIHTNVCIVACKYSWLVRKMSLRGLSILFAHATLHQRDAVASAESSWYVNLVVELFLHSGQGHHHHSSMSFSSMASQSMSTCCQRHKRNDKIQSAHQLYKNSSNVIIISGLLNH